MTRGGLDRVRRNPDECSRWLTVSGVVGGVNVTVARSDIGLTVFDVRFEPPPPEHLPGYPAERVRVTVRANGDIFAVPIGDDDRAWLHRYPRLSISELLTAPKSAKILWEHLLGPLCLEYPKDPDRLRWHWSDGIDAYVRIVQRHLWCEEYWRRHGAWPVEDTPHGHRPNGLPHPITNTALRAA